jgi:hypothetical protein
MQGDSTTSTANRLTETEDYVHSPVDVKHTVAIPSRRATIQSTQRWAARASNTIIILWIADNDVCQEIPVS